MRHYLWLMFLLFAALNMTCSNNAKLLEKRMTQIKCIGDTNPELALSMIDSIKSEATNSHSHIRMTYEMLLLRLNDKAYHLATSDIMAKQVVNYFEKNGNELEKQEAYYYCGSVYRDLDDTPRSLEFFLKAAEIGESYPKRDSMLLQHTYSNLHALFYNVQDFKNSLIYALNEYDLSCKLNNTGLLQIMHVATTYSMLDSTNKARKMFDQAYRIVCKHNNDIDYGNLASLIYNLSALGETDKARKCIHILQGQQHYKLGSKDLIAIGKYYDKIGNKDSAAIYYKKVMVDQSDFAYAYDASKFLFDLYEGQGNNEEAIKYAKSYVNISDSLDLGKRQEMAATVNNQYQYHLDRNKEMEAERKVAEYRNWGMALALCAIVMVSLFIIFHVKRRNSQLKTLVAMSRQLESAKSDKRLLQEEIDKKNRELAETKEQYAASSAEISSVKERLDNINRQLQQSRAELKSKEEMLASKMEQNRSFLSLLHRSELAGRAGDVLEAVKKSACGTKRMTAEDWRRIYAAINEMHPNFTSLLTERLGRFTEEQMQVCYLVRAGLTNPQIQNLTGLPRATVWRWVKKFGWAAT